MTTQIRDDRAHVALVGVSHTRTPAHLRERVHLCPDDAAALACSLAGEGREAVVLATCNRTELYLAGSDVAPAADRAKRALAGLGGGDALRSTVYVREDEAAVVHLCRVACGLESTVLGDTDVVAQVRGAFEEARTIGATGPLLDRVFATALAAAKRARAETGLSTGPTSIPAAAIALANRVAGPLGERRVLVVGSGRMARLAALNLRSRGCHDLAVANRTLDHGRRLADAVAGRAVEPAQLSEELAVADVVVSATSGRAFVLTAEHAVAAARRRGGRPLVVLDLALPRDVDPAFRDVPGCRLFNLDDLARVVAGTTEQRSAEAERADAIIREEADRLREELRARAAAPAIAALRRDAEDARRSVLARHSAELARLAPAERELVEVITSQLASKLLHAPTLALRKRAA